MDVKMKAEDFSGDYPTWDVKVTDGIVPIISDEEEGLQTATLAAFIEKGSIPQLPDCGVSWSSFLTGGITFPELDVEIRKSISLAGMDGYRPNYQINGDRLTLVVVKEIQ